MEYYKLGAGSYFFSKLFAPCPMLYAFKPSIPSFQYSNPPSAVALLRRTGCERSELSSHTYTPIKRERHQKSLFLAEGDVEKSFSNLLT